MYRGSLVGLVVWLIAACGAPSAPSRPAGAAGATAAPAKPAPTMAAPTAAAPSGQGYRPTPLSPAVPVKVAAVNSISDAGVFIALENGYFEQEGLAVDLQNVGGGAQTMIPLLGTGQLDVASGGIAPGLFNAAAREVPLRLVADKGSTPGPDWDFVALMVRKDLIESGRVRDYADLRGLTVAGIGRGAIAEVEVADALAKGGLTFDD